MLITVSILFTAPGALAYREGDLELVLGGSGSSDESFEGTVFNMEAALGYFMTRDIEATWRQGISFADAPDGHDWNGSTRLAFDYHLALGGWYPYLGANFGYLYGDTVKEQFIAGPELGVKFFVNKTTFINCGLEYQFLFSDTKEADDNFDDGRFVYIIGIGVKF